MPKGRWKKRKQRDEGAEQRPDQPAAKKQKKSGEWKEWVKENPRYEEYYKGQQGIVPPEEWEQFLAALRADLPTTFRIDRTSSFARLIRARLEEQCSTMTDLRAEGTAVTPPHAMAWYPDRCGWYFAGSRRVLRKIEGAHYEAWRQVLLTETEIGNISRQEAVSMVPAFFLDVRADHTVLDMCAAPGSKTAQLLELVALQGRALDAHDTEAAVPGLVIANDVDRDRCNLLLTRTRTGSNLLVTNYEAQLYPTLKLLREGSHVPLKIDRILCDVPCSGDGTMRKNPDVWQSWHVEGGVNVHPLQVQILARACQLLLQCAPRESGDRERIVYSTCSLNPVEDEAVIATTLLRHPELRLVNVEHVLPGLRRQPGLTHWRVRTRSGEWFDTHAALLASVAHDPAQLAHTTRKFQPSMFPPSDATGLNLHYCFRLLPHHQNSGGFFVAVLERVPPSVNNNNVAVAPELTPVTETPVTETPAIETPAIETPVTETPAIETPAIETPVAETPVTETPVTETPAPAPAPESEPKKQRQPRFGEPLSVLSEADLASEQWSKVKSFYGLRDEFPLRQVITRAQSGVSNRYYFVTARVRDLLQAQTHTFRVVHTGTKMFERADNQGPYCSLRICQEGAHLLYPYMTRRVIALAWDDLCTLLTQRHPFFTQFSAAVRAQLVDLLPGSCLFTLEPCAHTLHNRFVFAAWRGKNSCNLQMSSEEFKSIKALLGIVDPVTDPSGATTTDQSGATTTDQSGATTTDPSDATTTDQSGASDAHTSAQ